MRKICNKLEIIKEVRKSQSDMKAIEFAKKQKISVTQLRTLLEGIISICKPLEIRGRKNINFFI